MNCIPYFGTHSQLDHNGLDQLNIFAVKVRRNSHVYVQNMHFVEPILSNSLKNDRTVRREAAESQKERHHLHLDEMDQIKRRVLRRSETDRHQ